MSGLFLAVVSHSQRARGLRLAFVVPRTPPPRVTGEAGDAGVEREKAKRAKCFASEEHLRLTMIWRDRHGKDSVQCFNISLSAFTPPLKPWPCHGLRSQPQQSTTVASSLSSSAAGFGTILSRNAIHYHQSVSGVTVGRGRGGGACLGVWSLVRSVLSTRRGLTALHYPFY